MSAEVELAKSYLNAKDSGGPDRWERLAQVKPGSDELYFVD